MLKIKIPQYKTNLRKRYIPYYFWTSTALNKIGNDGKKYWYYRFDTMGKINHNSFGGYKSGREFARSFKEL